MSALKNRVAHETHKNSRNDRFNQQIYGVKKKPVIPQGIIGYWEPPSYIASQEIASKKMSRMDRDSIDFIDMRCFYTGVKCHLIPVVKSAHFNHSPTELPWLGTKDHLVPMRRDIGSCPVNIAGSTRHVVWCANIVNVTFGLAPLVVKLKIRQWLMTIPYDRTDTSQSAGMNIRWLIVQLLDEFRLKDRYPWSRDQNGNWWYPEISESLMNRWYKIEQEFLSLSPSERDLWIQKFVWHF